MPRHGGEISMTTYSTYILQNALTKKHYVGSTNNLQRRLEEHYRGQTESTRRKGKWKIIYKEEFNTNIEAKRREKVIKSYKGGNAFKKLLMRAEFTGKMSPCQGEDRGFNSLRPLTSGFSSLK